MEEFSLRKDYKSIAWGPTFFLNSLRSFAAGIVWFIIGVLIDPSHPYYFLIVGIPIIYFINLLPFGLLAKKLSQKNVPFSGAFYLFISFIVSVGDPLVYLLWKIKPDLFLIDKMSFFSLEIVIFILEEKENEEEIIEEIEGA
jgi:hypothetical protein